MRKERFGKFLSVVLSIAMVLSLSVTALAAEGETSIPQWDCVNISYPGFLEDLRKL